MSELRRGKQTKLNCSVMTSSSIRDLPDLISEVRIISGVNLFDFMILRDIDLSNMLEDGVVLSSGRPGKQATVRSSIPQVMACPQNYEKIKNWIISQCKEIFVNCDDAPIAALATYYPDITSAYEYRRAFTVDALVNTVRLALTLVKERFMKRAIVEMVCGTILDPCECKSCKNPTDDAAQPERIFEYNRDDKHALLCQALLDVVEKVNKPPINVDETQKPVEDFALALELEPGETYVLNNVQSLTSLVNKLRDYDELSSHVGLNLDIAHMKIARISASDLAPFRDQFVHAHISDHPGMHTRDQRVGFWTPIERWNSDYYPYLRLLAERADAAEPAKGLPFSYALALELEGCNRIGWIHQSLSAIKHLIETVYHHPHVGR